MSVCVCVPILKFLSSLFIKKKKNYLTVLSLRCGKWDLQLQQIVSTVQELDVGSSSLSRSETWAPSIGRRG